MAKTNSETGHAVNLGSLGTALSVVKSLGAAYNPSRSDLKVDQLEAFYRECDAAHTAVKQAETAYQQAVGARRSAFDALPALATRVVNAFVDSEATAADIKALRAVKRKIDGNAPKTVEAPTGEAAADKAYSRSQQGYVNLVDHFDGIITKCAANASYRPADADLKTDVLRTEVERLRSLNSAVDSAAAALRAARKNRAKLFYDEERGMVALGTRLRSHFRSRKEGGVELLKDVRFRSGK